MAISEVISDSSPRYQGRGQGEGFGFLFVFIFSFDAAGE
jgi:hypothetical protein